MRRPSDEMTRLARHKSRTWPRPPQRVCMCDRGPARKHAAHHRLGHQHLLSRRARPSDESACSSHPRGKTPGTAHPCAQPHSYMKRELPILPCGCRNATKSCSCKQRCCPRSAMTKGASRSAALGSLGRRVAPLGGARTQPPADLAAVRPQPPRVPSLQLTAFISAWGPRYFTTSSAIFMNSSSDSSPLRFRSAFANNWSMYLSAALMESMLASVPPTDIFHRPVLNSSFCSLPSLLMSS
mmetsp:Transcript_20019/g.49341  ORF Transcript_20019/g.49341 Transcript_20019/m.49341 type:complete len:240 (-) Transcript_20019:164-883(-)